jgi:hypothetical protein
MADSDDDLPVPTHSLIQRDGEWWCRVHIPQSAQGVMGTQMVTKSLRTSNRALANRRKHAVVAEVRAKVIQAIKADRSPN